MKSFTFVVILHARNMLCSITRASAATSNSGCSIRRAPRLSPSRGACGTCTHRTRTTRRHASTSDDGDVIGVLVVDHGSRRAASNAQLEAFAEAYAEATGRAIVEAAHMELAAPTIGEAFGKCVARGANFIVVAPFFLSPGRHIQEDIPQLVAEAAREHEDVKYLISAPIGLHPLMTEVIDSRVRHCLAHINDGGPQCDVCEGSKFGCQLRHSTK